MLNSTCFIVTLNIGRDLNQQLLPNGEIFSIMAAVGIVFNLQVRFCLFDNITLESNLVFCSRFHVHC